MSTLGAVVVRASGFILVLGACSGGATNSANTGGVAGSAGASGAVGGGLGGQGGAGPSGGTTNAGAGGGVVSGAGGAPLPGSCRGSFGAYREHFGAADVEFAGPTLSGDELELVYAQGTLSNSTDWHFRSSVRASKSDVFSPGSIMSDLDSACSPDQRRGGALTSDGLRLYFVCYVDPVTFAELRVARRPARGQPFVVDAMTYGTVGLSPSVTRNELELYTTIVSGNEFSFGLQRYTRPSINEPFGPPQPAPGLEGSLTNAPDLSGDGLELLFALDGGIAAAYRSAADLPFGSPVPFESLQMDVKKSVFGAPELSDDCRTMYAVRVELGPPMTFKIVSASR